MKNPFVVIGYAGPEYFCDRKEETQKLISALENGVNVTLRSPRRVGKTGLIHNAFYHIKQQKPECECFYIDIFATKTLSDFVQTFGQHIIGKLDTPIQRAEGFVAKFFRSCKLYFTSDPLSGQPQLGIDFAPAESSITLSEIFSYIRQSGKECYIALDEFQQIAEYPEGGVEALLRQHVQECNNVHFIFSGSKQHLMNELFTSPKRPFFRSTEKHNLENLPKDVYYQFAAEKMQHKGITLPQDIFNHIYDQLDGITWYMQSILNKLYAEETRMITAEDVQHCLREIIKSEESDYKQIYSLLTNNQAQVLRAIGKEGCVAEISGRDFVRKYNLPASSSIKRAIDYLLDKEYIYRTEKGYIIYDRFLALWIKTL